MVRFGNVLGSACSVLPIWTDQFLRGGPITVTHPDMQRYFMTIPEAAGLVLQSAAFSGRSEAAPTIADERGGEVFLLDMGLPIRILDLAERFISSQGLEPNVDMPIQITGPRPGEKLFEELAYGSEDMLPTPHPSVRLWRTQRPDPIRMKQLVAEFDRLRGQPPHQWRDATREQILAAMHDAVPEMVPAAG